MVVEEEEDPFPTTNVERNSSPPIDIMNGVEDEDAKRKRKSTSIWCHIKRKKVIGKLKA